MIVYFYTLSSYVCTRFLVRLYIYFLVRLHQTLRGLLLALVSKIFQHFQVTINSFNQSTIWFIKRDLMHDNGLNETASRWLSMASTLKKVRFSELLLSSSCMQTDKPKLSTYLHEASRLLFLLNIFVFIYVCIYVYL